MKININQCDLTVKDIELLKNTTDEIFMSESDYGKGGIIYKKDGFWCYEIPMYGGEQQWCYEPFETAEEVLKEIQSWT